MEDLDKEPEEIPMEDVLAEIRHMLSAQTESDSQETNLIENSLSETDQIPISSPNTSLFKEIRNSVISDKPEPVFEPDYFLLTPAMRCDVLFDTVSSDHIKLQTQKVIQKLNREATVTSPQLTPELERWLNQNLPALVEKAVANQLAKKMI